MEAEQRDRDRSRRGDRPSRFSDVVDSRDRTPEKKQFRVYVSNIPYEYKWTDVKDLFRHHVGDVTYVDLFNDDNEKPRGCGVVGFKSAESVKRAMEVMHRYPLQGRKLVIKEDFVNERDKYGHIINKGGRSDKDDRDGGKMDRSRGNENWNRPMGVGGQNIGNMPGERFNSYGLSAQFLDSIGVTGPLFNRLFVANLDYKVDKAKLKEVFKLAGKVRHIELSTDAEGNSKGFAIIRYDHPVEAVQAISMFDKQVLYERKLIVRMDRDVSEKPETILPEGLKGIGVGLGPNGEPLRDVARSVPQQMGSNTPGLINQQMHAGMGSGILGAVPAAGLALTGLNPNTFGGNGGLGIGTGLNLQALGLSGLGSLQTQLIQQGLAAAGDLSALGGAAGLNMGQGGNNMQDMTNNGQMQNPPFNNNALSSLVNNGNQGRNFGPMQGVQGGNFPPLRQGGMGMGGGNMDRDNSPARMPHMQQFLSRGGGNQVNDGPVKSMEMVIVRHLPASMTWQLLREKFSEAGEVKFAEKIDSETAVIRFQNEWGASQAVKLFDRTRVDGKTINVRYFEC